MFFVKAYLKKDWERFLVSCTTDWQLIEQQQEPISFEAFKH